MAEKSTTPEVNPKNIILRNPEIPGQVRRARKSELAWYAQRGWKPVESGASSVKRVGADPLIGDPK